MSDPDSPAPGEHGLVRIGALGALYLDVVPAVTARARIELPEVTPSTG
ncbi:hypothetical protein ACIGO9_30290 [Nocardia asteroides]